MRWASLVEVPTHRVYEGVWSESLGGLSTGQGS